MTTLEKWVKKVLETHNIYVNIQLIEAAAEQIERENENANTFYTPEDWYNDTKRNFPELLLGKDLYGPICEHFIEQRDLCFDETGRMPCIYDYVSEMESELFESRFQNVKIRLDDVFNFLLSYYAQAEGVD